MGGPVELLKDAIDALDEVGLDPSTPGGAVALSFLLGGAGAIVAAQHGTAPVAGPAPGSPGSPRPAGLNVADLPEAADSDDEPPEILVARWVGVDAERLLDALEFASDGVVLRVPSARLSPSKADRQRLLALLKLAIDRKAYGADEVSTQRVNAVCSDYGCMDQNIAGNLAAREDLIIRRGKRGAYAYRVTQPGIERARTLLHELLEGTEGLVV